MTLPQILDTGDGLAFDRDLAIEATRHILAAMKLLLELPTLQQQSAEHMQLAEDHVSDMLGGAHWRPIAQQLVDTVLEQEASRG